jgi:epoxyqueuosine reductase QueG
LANKTELGEIGDNFMFLHKEWGAWTHLRVIVTDVEISETLSTCGDVCNHCGICKTACPAKVIKDDTLLGVECAQYQNKHDTDIGIQGTMCLNVKNVLVLAPLVMYQKELLYLSIDCDLFLC